MNDDLSHYPPNVQEYIRRSRRRAAFKWIASRIVAMYLAVTLGALVLRINFFVWEALTLVVTWLFFWILNKGGE